MTYMEFTTITAGDVSLRGAKRRGNPQDFLNPHFPGLLHSVRNDA